MRRIVLLEDLIRRTSEALRLKNQALDEIMDRARKSRVLSKQAILLLHQGKIEEAESRLKKVKQLLTELNEVANGYPELRFYEQVSAAWEEYAEASIIFSINSGESIPDPERLSIPLSSFILGLGDVPGELRRQALDALRLGDIGIAEDRLRIMEEIYLSLTSLEEAPMLKGLRRKIDVARGVTERTRSEVTAEVGRRRLDEAVRSLREKLEE
jgi:translin